MDTFPCERCQRPVFVTRLRASEANTPGHRLTVDAKPLLTGMLWFDDEGIARTVGGPPDRERFNPHVLHCRV